MTNNIGIMQGRLADRKGFSPQQFPWSNWENEFYVASKYNVSCIEWMFNYEDYENNPLWTHEGRGEINIHIRLSEVSVQSVCANYFMIKGLFKDEAQMQDGAKILSSLFEKIREIGAHVLVLPLFEDNQIFNKELFIKCIEYLKNDIQKNDILLALETDLSAAECIELSNLIDNDRIGFCYDLGNAAGQGKDITQELNLLKDKIFEVHIKDKKNGGSTVMLGQGDVDYKSCLMTLKDNKYDGPLILETYYEDALVDTCKNINYLGNIMAEIQI